MNLQEVELARSQIFEIKGKSAPIVVVVNKIDLISSSFEQTVQHQPANSSDETTSTCTHNQHKSSFLCLEMVESLVTCDWGHGFVAASAKENLNVTQVTPVFFRVTVRILCYAAAIKVLELRTQRPI